MSVTQRAQVWKGEERPQVSRRIHSSPGHGAEWHACSFKHTPPTMGTYQALGFQAKTTL